MFLSLLNNVKEPKSFDLSDASISVKYKMSGLQNVNTEAVSCLFVESPNLVSLLLICLNQPNLRTQNMNLCFTQAHSTDNSTHKEKYVDKHSLSGSIDCQRNSQCFVSVITINPTLQWLNPAHS